MDVEFVDKVNTFIANHEKFINETIEIAKNKPTEFRAQMAIVVSYIRELQEENKLLQQAYKRNTDVAIQLTAENRRCRKAIKNAIREGMMSESAVKLCLETLEVGSE